ncbi:Crp/Fnr family transcriptional regulator, partial [Falsiroseomonas oryzae]|uniref:Crp/Fnr family transcriptional regulator n=1 Tax=Falsiroseomonas oryzae TaxID=2766473 RepID=UPI0022EB16BB
MNGSALAVHRPAMATDPVRQALDRLPLLAQVPDDARARLAAAARAVRFREGEPVFRCGDPGTDGMLIVLDGVVRLHLSTAAGRELTLGLVGAGEPVGEIAMIDGGPRSADATALTPVSGVMIRSSAAVEVIETDHAAALALLRAVAARIRRTTDQLEAVGLQPLPQRVAAAMLKLAAADPAGLVRLT